MNKDWHLPSLGKKMIPCHSLTKFLFIYESHEKLISFSIYFVHMQQSYSLECVALRHVCGKQPSKILPILMSHLNLTDSLWFEITLKDTKSYFQCKRAVLPDKYLSWLKVFDMVRSSMVYIEILQNVSIILGSSFRW